MGNLILRVSIESWIIDRENKQKQPKQRGGKRIFLINFFPRSQLIIGIITGLARVEGEIFLLSLR